MRFTVHADEFRAALDASKVISGLGGSEKFHAGSLSVSETVHLLAKGGKLTVTSQNTYGAAFSAPMDADIEEEGEIIASLSEIVTVTSVFGAERVEVEEIVGEGEDSRLLQVTNRHNRQASASAWPTNSHRVIPSIRGVDRRGFSATLDLQDFMSAWGVVSQCFEATPPFSHTAMNFDGGSLRFDSTNRLAYTASSVQADQDGGRFFGLVRPENMKRVLDVIHSYGAEKIRFYSTSSSDDRVGEAESLLLVAALREGEEVALIDLPMGLVEGAAALLESAALKKIGENIAWDESTEVVVARQDFMRAMDAGAAMCSLIPGETKGQAKEVKVAFRSARGGGIEISLPGERFDTSVPAKVEGEDVEVLIHWGGFKRIIASTPDGEELRIRLYPTRASSKRQTMAFAVFHDKEGASSLDQARVPHNWFAFIAFALAS